MAVSQADINEVKQRLRESEVPFFEDSEIEKQISLAGGDLDTATYNLAIMKSQNCSLAISGLTLPDSSQYWLRIAMMYRPSSTKIVG